MRVWPGGLAMSRTIGDYEAGDIVTGQPEVQQVGGRGGGVAWSSSSPLHPHPLFTNCPPRFRATLMLAPSLPIQSTAPSATLPQVPPQQLVAPKVMSLSIEAHESRQGRMECGRGAPEDGRQGRGSGGRALGRAEGAHPRVLEVPRPCATANGQHHGFCRGGPAQLEWRACSTAGMATKEALKEMEVGQAAGEKQAALLGGRCSA